MKSRMKTNLATELLETNELLAFRHLDAMELEIGQEMELEF